MKSDPDEVSKIRKVLKKNLRDKKILRVQEFKLNSDSVRRYLAHEVKLVKYGKEGYKVIAQTNHGEIELFCGGVPEKGKPKFSAVIVEQVDSGELYRMLSEQQKKLFEVKKAIERTISQMGLHSIIQDIEDFFKYRDF